MDVFQGRLHRRVVDDPAGDLPGQIMFDDADARIDPLAGQVVQTNLVARQGADMSDPAAHLARADHPDALYCRHTYCLRRVFERRAPRRSLLMTAF